MELIYKIDNNTRLIKMNLRHLIQKFESWSENRILNEDKIKKISTAYENNDIGLLTSPFRGVINGDKYILIDGHNRKEAALRVLEKFPHFDDNLYGLIIIHNDITDELFYNLHIRSNQCEPLEAHQIPTYKRSLLINHILNHKLLKNGISKNRNSKTAYGYKLSLNELAELAGKIIITYPEMDIELIVYNMNIINGKLSLLFTVDNLPLLFPKNKHKKDVIDKCNEHKFYLNIKDSIYNSNIWIKYLDNKDILGEVLDKIKESQ